MCCWQRPELQITWFPRQISSNSRHQVYSPLQLDTTHVGRNQAIFKFLTTVLRGETSKPRLGVHRTVS
ncbi:predicted protein [Botrytis cinerea T4]|uniref:Uncharacterized protein n=1 Tax=Botryotinia fuckeliana (strain T4) TaxID=999810 RepID=G2XT36_BOTF4|nr:predicted protein [Botrytis cinerea T4]